MMKNLLTGVLFFSLGIFFNFYAREYEMGSAQEMGPGFYPYVISLLLLTTGLILILKEFYNKWKD